jgi:ubiquitin carboxyl-terminal hydrolase 35/38
VLGIAIDKNPVSAADSYSKPSCALLHVIDKIPPAFLSRAARQILEDSRQEQNEAKTVVGLQTMIEWLTMLPTTGNGAMTKWIMEMLRGLQENDRNSILIEIGHSSTRLLALALADPALSPAVESVFFFLLLGFQHSEMVFHAVVSELPGIFEKLAADSENKTSRKLLCRLAEAAGFLMVKFPGYPDLYNPVRDALQNVGMEAPREERISDLKSLSWLSPIHSTTFTNQKAGGQNVASPRKRSRNAFLVDDALSYRSETGMVGLINLGNTCYMNSVLQALFITKE